MTIKQSFVTGRGETFLLNIEFTDPNGVAQDLTGHTVDFVVEKSRIGTLVGTYPATVDSAGNITVKVEDEVTALWPLGKLAYRLILTQPNGDKRWLLYGPITVMDGNDV